jgi:hypothetical protein
MVMGFKKTQNLFLTPLSDECLDRASAYPPLHLLEPSQDMVNRSASEVNAAHHCSSSKKTPAHHGTLNQANHPNDAPPALPPEKETRPPHPLGIDLYISLVE